MRLFFLGLLIVASNSLYSQKTYTFDYVLQYDLQIKKGAPIQKEYYYINSKDNSYKMSVVEKDSLNFTINFLDYVGNHAVVYFAKAEFLKSESISIPCKFVQIYGTNKLQTKNYDFSSLNDTLIYGVSYYHYVLKSSSIQREKRKKISRAHYIIDKESAFHLPIFFEDTAYEEWKVEKSIPNGFVFMEFCANTVNQELFLIRRLVKKESINKQLVVPDECDYEKFRKRIISLRKE